MDIKTENNTQQEVNQFHTVFISYGRQHSLAFARKLQNALVQNGYSAWFDMNDIPLGVDFQDQIDDGIRKADNFIFILSPHSIKSVYCYKELALALKYNKRIIPVMHVEPQTEDEWAKIDPEIGRRNWVQMKQDIRVATTLSKKALDLKEEILLVPNEEWKLQDDFGEALQALLGLIESHSHYVNSHTVLLHKALEWSNNQNNSQMLLVGDDRKRAETFLVQSHQAFRNPTGHIINSPCTPTELMANFVMESKKNSSNLQSDLFVCHDVDDFEKVHPIRSALAQHGFSSWISSQDIAKGTEYTQAIHDGVVKSSNLVFFLSKKSLQSIYCKKEYEFALQYNKRIIPVLIEPILETDIKEEDFPGLPLLQYINFTDLTTEVYVKVSSKEDAKADVEARRGKTPFEISINDLLNTLNTAKSYQEEHRRFLVQALRWKEKGERLSFLLRGFNLENAQSWLRINKNKEQYPPHTLHTEFIGASIAAKGQLGTEVFISYSRKDSDFARLLNEKLQFNEKTTWFDQESISEGVNFENEIFKGIAAANNFVFIVSPDSVESAYCEREVEYAAQLNKRFISIKLRDTDPEKMPEALRLINWIDFENDDFDSNFSKLIQAIEIDREYTMQHTTLQQRASEWKDNNQSSDYLLNAPACHSAEEWLEDAGYDLPEIPYELLSKEIKAKSEKSTTNWWQIATQKTEEFAQNLYVQVVIASYIWMLFWMVGMLYFNVIIGEGYDNFATATLFLLLAFLTIIPVWAFYKIQPVEIPDNKWSFKRLIINFFGMLLGLAPGILFLALIYSNKTTLNIDESVFAIGFAWGLAYFFAFFEVWLIVRQKKKRQKRERAGKLIEIGRIGAFFKNVLVQIMALFLFFKMLFPSDDFALVVTIFTVYYIFQVIPLRIFGFEHYQERPENKMPVTKKRITITVLLILSGWIVSIALVPSDSLIRISDFDENVVVVFFDYFVTLLVAYGLLSLKKWMRRKKQKRVYATNSVKDLAEYYKLEGKEKIPGVSGTQVEYIHESRTGIAVSKIELQETQKRLRNRLRVAWVFLLFMLLGVYAIFVLSTKINVHRTSGKQNLAYLMNNHFLQYDTIVPLVIENLNLIEIPDAVFYNSELKDITITRSYLRNVSEKIKTLTQLSRLELSNNLLTEMPDEVKHLVNLDSLILDNNKFESISFFICGLERLRHLNMSGNEIDKIPYQIKGLRALQELLLDNNEVKVIPKNIQELKNLRVLSITDNKIKQLPIEIGSLKNLTKLNVSNNELTELPVEILELENLEVLDLSENSIRTLPLGISKLKNLKELKLYNTFIFKEQIDSLRIELPNCAIETWDF